MSVESLVSIALGVGLAAACGFRVFVPLVVAALAARSGNLELAPGFEWLASDGAPLLVLAALVALFWLAARVVRNRTRTGTDLFAAKPRGK